MWPCSQPPIAIHIEIADDQAERAQGLMNRTPELAADSGMLFIFDEPRERPSG